MNLISYYCQKITVLEQNIEKNPKKVGWIIIVFKNYLEPFLHFPDTESDFVQWLKLSKKILNLDADLLMGCVYIPRRTRNMHLLMHFRILRMKCLT